MSEYDAAEKMTALELKCIDCESRIEAGEERVSRSVLRLY